MTSGVVAKYSKMVRKSDRQNVGLSADYFHKDAVRCFFLIQIEAAKIIHMISPCIDENGQRKIEGFYDVMQEILTDSKEKLEITDHRADAVEITEDEFVSLVNQYGFTNELLKEIKEFTELPNDSSIFAYARNAFLKN